jgi:acetyltransferase-like isoleucine patch superfamily enzyme
MITGDHDYNSVNFSFRSKDIYIDDYVWIGARATILPGVRLGRGAVICAGAVVTKDVEDFAVVAGIPAVKIRERNRNINYNPSWMGYFD